MQTNSKYDARTGYSDAPNDNFVQGQFSVGRNVLQLAGDPLSDQDLAPVSRERGHSVLRVGSDSFPQRLVTLCTVQRVRLQQVKFRIDQRFQNRNHTRTPALWVEYDAQGRCAHERVWWKHLGASWTRRKSTAFRALFIYASTCRAAGRSATLVHRVQAGPWDRQHGKFTIRCRASLRS